MEHFSIPPDRYYEFGQRWDDWEWILSELGLESFRPILQAFCNECHSQSYSDPSLSYSDPSGVTIGPQQPSVGYSQFSWDAAVATDGYAD